MSHYRPSPTVRTSIIPMYMRGFPSPHHLGQDGTIDTSIYDPSDDLIPPTSDIPVSTGLLPSIGPVTPMSTTMYDPSGNLIAPAPLDPQTQALAQLYQNSVAAGTMTQAQANSAIAQLATGAAAVAKAATGVSTAAAPRVALPAVATTPSIFTQSTMIPGVPDILLLGGGLLLAVGLAGKR
jgi:hypothetical protein